jgi:hypothetical protein
MVKVSKSENLHIYPEFFKYRNPKYIPYEFLAAKLGVSLNKLHSLKGQAENNPNIYFALRNIGYKDRDVPSWFKRQSVTPVETPVVIQKETRAREQSMEVQPPQPLKPKKLRVHYDPSQFVPKPKPYYARKVGEMGSVNLYERVTEDQYYARDYKSYVEKRRREEQYQKYLDELEREKIEKQRNEEMVNQLYMVCLFNMIHDNNIRRQRQEEVKEYYKVLKDFDDMLNSHLESNKNKNQDYKEKKPQINLSLSEIRQLKAHGIPVTPENIEKLRKNFGFIWDH